MDNIYFFTSRPKKVNYKVLAEQKTKLAEDVNRVRDLCLEVKRLEEGGAHQKYCTTLISLHQTEAGL